MLWAGMAGEVELRFNDHDNRRSAEIEVLPPQFDTASSHTTWNMQKLSAKFLVLYGNQRAFSRMTGGINVPKHIEYVYSHHPLWVGSMRPYKLRPCIWPASLSRSTLMCSMQMKVMIADQRSRRQGVASEALIICMLYAIAELVSFHTSSVMIDWLSLTHNRLSPLPRSPSQSCNMMFLGTAKCITCQRALTVLSWWPCMTQM